MMWARNLLFLGLCASALVAFKASVFPAADVAPPKTTTPDVDSLRPTVGRVDAALAEVWQANDLRPAAPAQELTVARRLSLALTGTIPSLEELRQFEQQPGGQRIDWWLTRLLADRRWSDYVAERLARAYVGVDDGPFLLYRRRRFVSWLSDQLFAGAAYDQIVRHLIADVGLWTDTPATNFITVSIQPDQDPDAKVLAARVSRAFLGIRIDCAECHDHPFEPWKQQDFQHLAAFFGTTRQSLRGIRDVAGEYQVENRQTGEAEAIACAVPFAAELLPDEGSPRVRLAAWVTDRKNRPFAREAVNRAWALLFGRALVEPLDNLGTAGPFPPVMEILADDFVANRYDLRRLLAAIASSEAFRLDSTHAGGELTSEDFARHERHWAIFPLTRLRPEQVIGALQQASSLATIDESSHIVVRFAREIGQRDFVRRYGDAGAEEFEPHGGTIPQRLLLMNGNIVQDKTKDNQLFNAATQIASLASDDAAAVETAMLCVLTRRPHAEEAAYFASRLEKTQGAERKRRLGDLVWTLVNGTEFSWNH